MSAPVDPHEKAAFDEWTKRGDELMAFVESGRLGIFAGIFFRLGAWWADRPWRARDATKETKNDF